MKLNSEQINRLYSFTRKHFVEHVDLQMELVDHLANGIEQQWLKKPDLSFEEALEMEFKKFGVFGFSGIVEKQSWLLEKKYWKFIGKHLLGFFKIPRILLTSLIFLITFNIVSFSSQTQMNFLLLLFVVPLVVFVRKAYLNLKEYKQKTRVEQKKWLLEEHIFRYGSGIVILNLLVQILFNGRYLFTMNIHPNWYLISLSVFITLFYIVAYIMIFYIPKKAEEYLENHYLEYKIRS